MARKSKIGPGARNLYVRLDQETLEELSEIARARGVDRAVIIREAIGIYLAGGAEEYAREMERVIKAHGPTTAERAVLRWFRQLHPPVRERVVEIGTALQHYMLETGRMPAGSPS